MSWVKLDDRFLTNPKAVQAGLHGRALYIAGLCYANANLTDGTITKAALPIVAATAGVKPSTAKQLVTVGLWEEHADGYQVHDYLEYNATREQAEQKRDEITRKKSEAGKKGARARWQTDSTGHGKPDGTLPLAVPSDADGKPMAPSHPIPTTSSLHTPPAGDDRGHDEDLKTRSFDVVSHRKLELRCARGETPPRDPEAWCATVAANDSAALGSLFAELQQRHPSWPPERFADELDPDSAPIHPHTRALQQAQAEAEQRDQEATERAAADPVTPQAYEAARAAIQSAR